MTKTETNLFGSGYLSSYTWIYIQIWVDSYPPNLSSYIRIYIHLYPDKFSIFLMVNAIMISMKNYIVGKFLTIRIKPDFHPDIARW